MIQNDFFKIIGDRNLSRQIQEHGLVEMIRGGFPAESVFGIQRVAGLSKNTIESITGISFRTIQRHVEKKDKLSPVVSDRLVRFINILNEASRTFGNEENGIAWMNRPCRPLGDKKPIELVDNVVGASQVTDILGRIRHGVFS